jgi:hypothetical protein
MTTMLSPPISPINTATTNINHRLQKTMSSVKYLYGPEYDIPFSLDAQEREQLYKLVHKWPPVVDGFCYQNEKEVDAVIQLRASLSDLEGKCHFHSLDIRDIRHLLCFARARKLHVKKAEIMFRESYKWHSTHRPIEKHSHFRMPLAMEVYGTGGPCGFDKQSSPLWVDRMGEIDPAGLLKYISIEEWMVIHSCEMEFLTAQLNRATIQTGKLHIGSTVIVDLTGLGIRHLTCKEGLKALQMIAAQADANYPERAKIFIIINAPRVFSAIWNIVQHFFDPSTREKIKIHSDDAKDVIAQYVDGDQLPDFLGGKIKWKWGSTHGPFRVEKSFVLDHDWEIQDFHDALDDDDE